MVFRRLFLGALVFVNLLLAYRIFFSEQGFLAYLDLKGKKADLLNQSKELGDLSQDLSQEIRWLRSDRAAIEEAIRTDMKFLKDNEIIYLFPKKRGAEDKAPEVQGDRAGVVADDK